MSIHAEWEQHAVVYIQHVLFKFGTFSIYSCNTIMEENEQEKYIRVGQQKAECVWVKVRHCAKMKGPTGDVVVQHFISMHLYTPFFWTTFAQLVKYGKNVIKMIKAWFFPVWTQKKKYFHLVYHYMDTMKNHI